MFWASSIRETHRNSKELHNYQNFISRHFWNQSGTAVFVNWPRAHCGVHQLNVSKFYITPFLEPVWNSSFCKLATCPLRSSPIEASSAGPDSPRTSPRNETVKKCRRQTTVGNYPVQWPSWAWCRTWWNHSWHSSRVTLNQRCFAFIHPRNPLVYRHHAISRTQSHSVVFWLLPIGMDGSSTPRVVVWQLSNFCIGRIEYGPDGRNRLTQKQSLDSGI